MVNLKYASTASSAILIAAILVLPSAAWAGHDGDPFPDSFEQILCGSPLSAGLVNGLPSSGGRCDQATGDYSSPFVTPAPCPECEQEMVHSTLDEPLTPGQDVDAIPLPPEEVPPLGPFGTPPVEHPAGTAQGQKVASNPQRYCVTVTPEGGTPVGQCMDLGPVGPLVPDFGPLEVVNVPSQPVGPTPGVEEGELGATPENRAPATTMDLVVGIRWVEPKLNQRLGPGLVNSWEPVDLDDPVEVEWWVENGNKTTLDLLVVLKFDGETQQTIDLHVPYVGQAAAALFKSLGT